MTVINQNLRFSRIYWRKGKHAFSIALGMAAVCALSSANTLYGAEACDEWTIQPNPVYDGEEYRPTFMVAFAPDSAVSFGLLPGVGLARSTWDGTTWTPGMHDELDWGDAPYHSFEAVTGSGQNDVWATGSFIDPAGIDGAYLARFDGQQWVDYIEGTLPDGRSGGANALVVIAPDDIWVVGGGDPPIGHPFTYGPVAMHWDGTELTEIAPILPVFNSLNRIEAVDAAASDAVWLVGSGRNLGAPDSRVHLMIYGFDGSTWNPQTDWTQLPGSESLTEQLWDVVAFAHDDAWAFGQKLTAAGTESLYLHWDGTSWTEVAGPDIGPITSAVASGPNEIWASCAFGEYQGELAHWDGTNWTVEPSATILDATHIGLTNLAASPQGDVWAVGHWGIYNGQGGWEVFEEILEQFVPCTASAEVAADAFDVVRGRMQSGGLDELADSDDQRMVVNAGITLQPGEPPVWIELDGVSPVETPAEFSFQLEASTTAGQITQRIELFNYQTQSFEEVDSRNSTPTDSIVEAVPGGDPIRFVEQGTGNMRARLTWKANGIVLAYPWTVRIDQAVWIVVPD